jgi:hypothetical protein
MWLRAIPRIMLLCAAAGGASRAQELSVRVVDRDGAPLGLTSVLIRPASGDSSTTVQRLTSAAGTLRQSLPAGSYTVIARRVGFRADSARVRADSTVVPVVLRLARLPQTLVTMVVRETRDCGLDDGPGPDAETELWDEVLKGIEARRLLRESYRFERRYHRVITQHPSIGATRVRTTDSVEINDPRIRDSSRFTYRGGGYTASAGNRVNIRIFDEGDLTEASFLRYHCHSAPWRDSTDGAVRIAFAPRRGIRESEGQNLVRGVVVMDGATWLIRAVTYDYVKREKRVGHGQVTYVPTTVDGAVVALPTQIAGELRLSALFGLRSQRASWSIDQAHSAFERLPDPAR